MIKGKTGESELQKIYKYSSQQFLRLVDELLKVSHGERLIRIQGKI